MTDPLCLEEYCQGSSGVYEEKIHGQRIGHIVSKCKEDEFEGIDVTNFEFMEDISDIS